MQGARESTTEAYLWGTLREGSSGQRSRWDFFRGFPFMNKQRIILTGFMGTGKTVVGNKLAERLHYYFIDLDCKIEEETGQKIRDIFAQKGEPYFRKLEKETLQQCLRQENMVLSVGGGTIVDPENCRLMKEAGWVITLNAPPEILAQRLKGDESRPLLLVDNPLEKMTQLLEKREKAYLQAHWVLDTSLKSVVEVVDAILERYYEEN